MFCCPRRYQERDQWIEHALTHLSDCSPPNPEFYRRGLRCRCTKNFLNKSWRRIITHLFDRHIHGKDEPRSCGFLCNDLKEYLEGIGKYPVAAHDGPNIIGEPTDDGSQWSHPSEQSVPRSFPGFERGAAIQDTYVSHAFGGEHTDCLDDQIVMETASSVCPHLYFTSSDC